MMNVKHLVLFTAIVGIVSSISNAIAQAHYQTTPVIADGYINDWQLPLRFANKEYSLSYNVTNDSKNIYFVAYTKDWKMMKRVLKEGITLYYDPKGGESKKKMAITFPEQKSDLANLLRDADSTSILNTLVLQSEAFDAENFLDIDNGQYGVTDKASKIQVGLKATIDSGLVYEVIVPIEDILKDGVTAKNLKKSISVGFVIHADDSWKKPASNGIKDNNNAASAFQNDNGFGTRGGAAGLGGTGMQGGGGMHRNAGYSRLNNERHEEEEEKWYTFSFAK